MRIVRLETFTRPFVAIVRVTLEDGSQGFGQMSPYHADISTEVFHRLVAPKALGQDGTRIEAVVEHVFSEQLKFPGTFLCRAIAGLDTALWDAAGKREEKPVWALLGAGGGVVPVYASSMSREITPDGEVERFRRLGDAYGFRAFKFRIGQKNGRNGDAWEGRTPAMIRTVGEAFAGTRVKLLVDGNSCYDVEHALRIGRMLEDAGISQFEEPCPYWQYDDTRAVARELDIPVSGGEQDNYLPAWQYMVATDVVDVCQPDLCYVGGVSRALKVAKIAEGGNKPVMFHAANSSLVTLFSLHVMAALPNAGSHCEFNIEPNAFHDVSLDRFFSPPLAVDDGAVALGDAPGWGVAPDDDWLAGAQWRESALADMETRHAGKAIS
ncbi:mandelate racemase/muconate lactonizing enzyme family protein [Oricola thermophila]|uniref:Mandelate racemase/muconate lactonizing enzyme family protein n=1 Tax=Oricola thermophila TaxID=2742145 RepID=A0A6N1VBM6_9HYPH|nr:mandelate racemase/muconate lactonizing enzyme family protein [Oricola thermophila]QKV18304.1 mandelate racemase/muconate lactonizing enzyme family protein [Oricola thermophila]